MLFISHFYLSVYKTYTLYSCCNHMNESIILEWYEWIMVKYYNSGNITIRFGNRNIYMYYIFYNVAEWNVSRKIFTTTIYNVTKPCISLIFFLLCRELIDMIFILTLQVCQNQNMDVLSLLSISFMQTGQEVLSLHVIIFLKRLWIALELQ